MQHVLANRLSMRNVARKPFGKGTAAVENATVPTLYKRCSSWLRTVFRVRFGQPWALSEPLIRRQLSTSPTSCS